jgi:hypothetical protein
MLTMPPQLAAILLSRAHGRASRMAREKGGLCAG